MTKTDEYYRRIQDFKHHLRLLPDYVLKDRLSSGMLQKEAAIAMRELLEERQRQEPIPGEVMEAFYAGKTSEGVTFTLNQSVMILEASMQGKGGAVISIVTLDPEPTYLIELGDGTGDVEIPQSLLRSAE